MSSFPPSNPELLSMVNDTKELWNVLVRVERLWRVADRYLNKPPSFIEMLVCDSQGTQILLVLKRQLFYKFEIDMVEGSVYNMSRLSSAANLGEYRVNRHAWKLSITGDSVIRRTDARLVSPSAYTFIPPADI